MSDAHHSAGADITIHRVQPQEHGRMFVLTSSALDEHANIDPVFSVDGDNLSPALSWTQIPEAETYALVVEDPDAPRERPFVHWMIWNIPGTAGGLPQGVPQSANPGGDLGSAVQGENDGGQHGYMGPKPPAGHGVHHYHFQLFALSAALHLGPNTKLPELVNALKGLTLASAEMVGLFETPDAA
jgi:Raf kinase inhibitor-like YbhB/YbcL family protein